MIFKPVPDLPGFGRWLTNQLGGQWCVANRLTDALRGRGYDVAISQTRYTAMKNRHAALTLACVMLRGNPADCGLTIGE